MAFCALDSSLKPWPVAETVALCERCPEVYLGQGCLTGEPVSLCVCPCVPVTRVVKGVGIRAGPVCLCVSLCVPVTRVPKGAGQAEPVCLCVSPCVPPS